MKAWLFWTLFAVIFAASAFSWLFLKISCDVSTFYFRGLPVAALQYCAFVGYALTPMLLLVVATIGLRFTRLARLAPYVLGLLGILSAALLIGGFIWG